MNISSYLGGLTSQGTDFLVNYSSGPATMITSTSSTPATTTAAPAAACGDKRPSWLIDTDDVSEDENILSEIYGNCPGNMLSSITYSTMD